MIKSSVLHIFLFASLLITGPDVAHALNDGGESQDTNDNGRINVFLDGQHWWLDEDFIREEVPIVNYVRDKEAADVHILMSRHRAGRAGINYVLTFIGRRAFQGMEHELTYWAPASNTSYCTREGYTNMIKVGLVKFIAQTDLADRIMVDFDYDKEAIIKDPDIEPEVDPWNNWVFELYGGANISKEEKQSSWSSRFGFYADRVTQDWKIRFRPYFNFSERTYLTDEDTIVSSSHRHGHRSYVIKSIDDHWSFGVFSSSRSSTFHNMKFNFEVNPALEYSIFPYEEATRRSITFAYRMGYGYHNYMETTIFEKDAEFLWSQSIEAAARFQQPWGNMRGGISGSHYFHDFSFNRVEVFANINFRIIQGLSLNVNTNLNLINDLISIPAGDLSVEEILLEQSQQSTTYSLSGTIGLSYTFGSEYSAAYNPRL